MKLAYVTTYESSDKDAWSGSVRYIYRSLEHSGFGMEGIGGFRVTRPWRSIANLKRKYYSSLRSRGYRSDREPGILKGYARQVRAALRNTDVDCVFSPGTIPIAYLRTEKPIVFWTDATFAGMVDFYPNFTNLCAKTIKDGNRMEQAALSKCHLAVYASEWAARTAVENYDVDPSKVKVVPFGANLDCNRSKKDIEDFVSQKEAAVCKLLFVGVDWSRKGGDTALSVAVELNKRGLRTELHVVGCEPPGNRLPDFVFRHGFLSKRTQAERKRLEMLFSEAHFFLMPAKSECYGVVFAEASSFGVPSLATNVGGIPSVIRDQRNGRTFGLSDGPEAYCVYIERLLSSRADYRRMALSSFDEYEHRLNWEAAGRQVREHMRPFCV